MFPARTSNFVAIISRSHSFFHNSPRKKVCFVYFRHAPDEFSPRSLGFTTGLEKQSRFPIDKAAMFGL